MGRVERHDTLYPFGYRTWFCRLVHCVYLLIPFINRLLYAMSKREFQYLLALLIGVFSIVGTFIPFGFYEYIGWYVTIYFVGAYIRLHGLPMMQSRHRETVFLWTSLLAVNLSVVAIFYLTKMKGSKLEIGTLYYFFSDSNKILALLTSVALFLFFKDMKLPQISWVNKIATATFGVLLIHGNSNTMREWLWGDVLKNVSYIIQPLPHMVLHAIASVVAVYVVCVIIDLLRIKYIEQPLFQWIGRKDFKIRK
ncbi:acyltransferase family protein [Hoylesella shahii]|uniref:acyltransferase family protein n=1 Tax=Hoylesella shahii TaxID=228603 RepID=UPI0028D879B7|nr:acyltransferase family protein [Hoylesella shahii]